MQAFWGEGYEHSQALRSFERYVPGNCGGAFAHRECKSGMYLGTPWRVRFYELQVKLLAGGGKGTVAELGPDIQILPSRGSLSELPIGVL